MDETLSMNPHGPDGDIAKDLSGNIDLMQMDSLFACVELGPGKSGLIPEASQDVLKAFDRLWLNNLKVSYFNKLCVFHALKRDILMQLASVQGYCWMWLAMASDGLMLAHPLAFYKVLKDAKESLKMMPKGKEVVGWLAGLSAYSMDSIFEHLPSNGWHPECPVGVMDLENLMKSRSRFTLEELPDWFHVTPGHFGPCNCDDDLHCTHGFAARYPLTVLASNDKMVGAGGPPSTIDFNAFFESESDEPADYSTAPVHTGESGFRIEHKSQVVNEDPYPRSLSTMTPTPTARIPRSSQANTQAPEQQEKTELTPDDSSSNISRYQRRYLHPGTVLTSRRGSARGVEQDEVVEYRLPAIPEVVIGYIKTTEIARREILNHHKVTPINGLARPFTNQRLNLLMHLNTAIVRISGSERPAELVSLLRTLWQNKSRTPTIELLNQVINLTFDWEGMVVESNPFQLPYIEPGMKISDDCLAKCLDLLWLEYKRLWFENLKNLIVPSFSMDYASFSDGKLSSESRRRRRSHSESPADDKQRSSPRTPESRRSRSILGFPVS